MVWEQGAGLAEFAGGRQTGFLSGVLGERLFEIDFGAGAGEAGNAGAIYLRDHAVSGPPSGEALWPDKNIVLVIGMKRVGGWQRRSQRRHVGELMTKYLG